MTDKDRDLVQSSLIPRGQLPRSIVTARWDDTANTLDMASIIAGDQGRLGAL